MRTYRVEARPSAGHSSSKSPKGDKCAALYFDNVHSTIGGIVSESCQYDGRTELPKRAVAPTAAVPAMAKGVRTFLNGSLEHVRERRMPLRFGRWWQNVVDSGKPFGDHACCEGDRIHRTGSTNERSQGMDAMHLLLIAIAILAELAGIAFLVGQYPINPALRWKKE